MAQNLNIRFANLDLLAPKVRRLGLQAIEECKATGYDVNIFETWRSLERQESLYAQGRTKPGRRVTNALPGKSFHLHGLAFDWAFKVKGNWSWDESLPYDKVVAIFMSHGFEKPPSLEQAHCQISGGLDIDHIRRIVERESVFALWAKLELY